MWWLAGRQLPAGSAGLDPPPVGMLRIAAWQAVRFYDRRPALAAGGADRRSALVGVVTFGSLTGSDAPVVLRRLGFDPAKRLRALRGHPGRRVGSSSTSASAYVLLQGTLL